MTDLTAPKSPESSQTHGQGWRPRIPFPTISSLMYLIIHSLNIRWMASSSRYFACHSWPASPSPQGAPGCPRGLALGSGLGDNQMLRTQPTSHLHSLLSLRSEFLLWGLKVLVSQSSGRVISSPLHTIPGDLWPRASRATEPCVLPRTPDPGIQFPLMCPLEGLRRLTEF